MVFNGASNSKPVSRPRPDNDDSMQRRLNGLFDDHLIPEPVGGIKTTEFRAGGSEEDQPETLPVVQQPAQAVFENSTIAFLPMQDFKVNLEDAASLVDKAFRNSPDLIGVIVYSNGKISDIISRRRFYEMLGRQFGVAVFLNRSVQTMLEQFRSDTLVVKATDLIADTVHVALNRGANQIFEPLLVDFGNEKFCLLDIYTLLLAQTNLMTFLREQVQKINVELEQRVKDRTAALRQEIEVRHHAEQMLETRLGYEKTLNLCASVLLAGSDHHETVQKTLTYLIDSIKASRVFVLDYVDINEIGPSLKVRNQVNASHVHPIPNSMGVFPESIFKRWFNILWRGKPVFGKIDPAEPRMGQLSELGIDSILMLPIGEPDHWLGAIGFAETGVERTWDMNDIQLLQTIAQMLYAYFERRRTALELSQAHDEALKASQFKSELLAKVSHELRTPLGAVLGYAQLLYYGSYGELNNDQKGAAEIVINSTRYLNTLVNSILDQAHLESRQLKLNSLPFDIRQMASNVQTRMHVLAEKKGLAFQMEIDSSVPEKMLGDQMRIEQILINLLGNAIKFTEVGSIGMHISLPDENTLSIVVSDTGAGISPEDQAKIFEPFVQVDGSITRQHGGTGLGLTITKQLVTLMKGHIKINSELGKGSTFTVTLPIH
jgi:signal transduction histidine kinase